MHPFNNNDYTRWPSPELGFGEEALSFNGDDQEILPNPEAFLAQNGQLLSFLTDPPADNPSGQPLVVIQRPATPPPMNIVPTPPYAIPCAEPPSPLMVHTTTHAPPPCSSPINANSFVEGSGVALELSGPKIQGPLFAPLAEPASNLSHEERIRAETLLSLMRASVIVQNIDQNARLYFNTPHPQLWCENVVDRLTDSISNNDIAKIITTLKELNQLLWYHSAWVTLDYIFGVQPRVLDLSDFWSKLSELDLKAHTYPELEEQCHILHFHLFIAQIASQMGRRKQTLHKTQADAINSSLFITNFGNYYCFMTRKAPDFSFEIHRSNSTGPFSRGPLDFQVFNKTSDALVTYYAAYLSILHQIRCYFELTKPRPFIVMESRGVVGNLSPLFSMLNAINHANMEAGYANNLEFCFGSDRRVTKDAFHFFFLINFTGQKMSAIESIDRAKRTVKRNLNELSSAAKFKRRSYQKECARSPCEWPFFLTDNQEREQLHQIIHSRLLQQLLESTQRYLANPQLNINGRYLLSGQELSAYYALKNIARLLPASFNGDVSGSGPVIGEGSLASHLQRKLLQNQNVTPAGSQLLGNLLHTDINYLLLTLDLYISDLLNTRFELNNFETRLILNQQTRLVLTSNFSLGARQRTDLSETIFDFKTPLIREEAWIWLVCIGIVRCYQSLFQLDPRKAPREFTYHMSTYVMGIMEFCHRYYQKTGHVLLRNFQFSTITQSSISSKNKTPIHYLMENVGVTQLPGDFQHYIQPLQSCCVRDIAGFFDVEPSVYPHNMIQPVPVENSEHAPGIQAIHNNPLAALDIPDTFQPPHEEVPYLVEEQESTAVLVEESMGDADSYNPSAASWQELRLMFNEAEYTAFEQRIGRVVQKIIANWFENKDVNASLVQWEIDSRINGRRSTGEGPNVAGLLKIVQREMTKIRIPHEKKAFLLFVSRILNIIQPNRNISRDEIEGLIRNCPAEESLDSYIFEFFRAVLPRPSQPVPNEHLQIPLALAEQIPQTIVNRKRDRIKLFETHLEHMMLPDPSDKTVPAFIVDSDGTRVHVDLCMLKFRGSEMECVQSDPERMSADLLATYCPHAPIEFVEEEPYGRLTTTITAQELQLLKDEIQKNIRNPQFLILTRHAIRKTVRGKEQAVDDVPFEAASETSEGSDNVQEVVRNKGKKRKRSASPEDRDSSSESSNEESRPLKQTSPVRAKSRAEKSPTSYKDREAEVYESGRNTQVSEEGFLPETRSYLLGEPPSNQPLDPAAFWGETSIAEAEKVTRKTAREHSFQQIAEKGKPFHYPILQALEQIGPIVNRPLFNRRLKPYQQREVNSILHHLDHNISQILASDMGLGKTPMYFATLTDLYAQGKVGSFVVITPKAVVFSAEEDLKRFLVESLYTAWEVCLNTGNADERKLYQTKAKKKIQEIFLQSHNSNADITLALLLLGLLTGSENSPYPFNLLLRMLNHANIQKIKECVIAHLCELQRMETNEQKMLAVCDQFLEILNNFSLRQDLKGNARLKAAIEATCHLVRERNFAGIQQLLNQVSENRWLFLKLSAALLSLHPDRRPLSEDYPDLEKARKLLELSPSAVRGFDGEHKKALSQAILSNTLPQFTITTPNTLLNLKKEEGISLKNNAVAAAVIDEAQLYIKPTTKSHVYLKEWFIESDFPVICVTGTPFKREIDELVQLLVLSNLKRMSIAQCSPDQVPKTDKEVVGDLLISKKNATDRLIDAAYKLYHKQPLKEGERERVIQLQLTAFAHMHNFKKLILHQLARRTSKEDPDVLNDWDNRIPVRSDTEVVMKIDEEVRIQLENLFVERKENRIKHFEYDHRAALLLIDPSAHESLEQFMKKFESSSPEQKTAISERTPLLNTVITCTKIAELISKKGKILFVCNHVPVAFTVSMACQNHFNGAVSTRVYYGELNGEQRKNIVAWYNESIESSTAKFLFMTKAGSIGLNLFSDMVVLLESAWSPTDDEQSIDRARRVGRDGHVEVLTFTSSTFMHQHRKVVSDVKKKKYAYYWHAPDIQAIGNEFHKWCDVEQATVVHNSFNDKKDPKVVEDIAAISDGLLTEMKTQHVQYIPELIEKTKPS